MPYISWFSYYYYVEPSLWCLPGHSFGSDTVTIQKHYYTARASSQVAEGTFQYSLEGGLLGSVAALVAVAEVSLILCLCQVPHVAFGHDLSMPCLMS